MVARLPTRALVARIGPGAAVRQLLPLPGRMSCYSCHDMWGAGADGVAMDGFCARETGTGAVKFNVVETAAALVELDPQPEIRCIGIPIGLPDRGGRE